MAYTAADRSVTRPALHLKKIDAFLKRGGTVSAQKHQVFFNGGIGLFDAFAGTGVRRRRQEGQYFVYVVRYGRQRRIHCRLNFDYLNFVRYWRQLLQNEPIRTLLILEKLVKHSNPMSPRVAVLRRLNSTINSNVPKKNSGYSAPNQTCTPLT